MDTLEGLLYLETFNGMETWHLAVEDPKNKDHTRIIECVEEKVRNLDRKFGRKRSGHWKFKAFRFKGKIKTIKTLDRSLHDLWFGLSDDNFRQIPVSELKKLEEWTD